MKYLNYFIQFILTILCFILFKILGPSLSSRLSGKIFEKIGPFFRSKKVIHNIVNSKWLGFNIKAWFSPEVSVDNSQIISYKGGFEEMKNWLKNNYVDSVIIASDNHDLRKVISFFGNTSLNVYYLPNWSDSTMKLSISNIGSQKIFSIWESNQLPLVLLIKRIADFVISILILLLVFPLMIFIYLILN